MVSVGFFAAVEKYLRRTHGGKDVCVEHKVLNRWINLLGQIEYEYKQAVEAARKENGACDG